MKYMEDKILINEYRSLHSGDKSKWNQLTSFGQFIWDDVYAIRLAYNDVSLDLPFKIEENEIVNLVVKDQTCDANTQNDRIIVQTLTRVDRMSGNVITYTRTRRYSNGEHKWGEWTTVNENVKSGVGVVEQTDVSVSIKPNVLNIWGEVLELDITLAAPTDNTIINEYMIQYESGEVATTLILPENIRWVNNKIPIIAENKIYQISILNGLAVCLEFSS